jgi:hypothetical protein
MTGQQPFPEAVRIYLQAEALRRAFPAWSFAVHVWPAGRARIEAVNSASADPYALISTDPAEIWAELGRPR